MATTTISPKFQIVIPKEVREKLRLAPSQRLQVVEKGGVITLVPEVPLKSLKGRPQGHVYDRSPREEQSTVKVVLDSVEHLDKMVMKELHGLLFWLLEWLLAPRCGLVRTTALCGDRLDMDVQGGRACESVRRRRLKVCRN